MLLEAGLLIGEAYGPGGLDFTALLRHLMAAGLADVPGPLGIDLANKASPPDDRNVTAVVPPGSWQ